MRSSKVVAIKDGSFWQATRILTFFFISGVFR